MENETLIKNKRSKSDKYFLVIAVGLTIIGFLASVFFMFYFLNKREGLERIFDAFFAVFLVMSLIVFVFGLTSCFIVKIKKAKLKYIMKIVFISILVAVQTIILINNLIENSQAELASNVLLYVFLAISYIITVPCLVICVKDKVKTEE